MAQVLTIHPDDPQKRLLESAAEYVRNGAVMVYPTDSAYALGCKLQNKDACERIRRLRQLEKNHNFTLVVSDLSQLASFAVVDNTTFRRLKANTPGPYTFILTASREVPRRLLNPKRKTIGLRVPDNAITQGLLKELGEPLMSVTLILPGNYLPLADPDNIIQRLQKQVDLIIDGGNCGLEPTTIINMVDGKFELVRQGKGKI